MNRIVLAAFFTCMSFLCTVSSASAASFAKGTVIKTELVHAIDTSTLKVGDPIELRVIQPYPNDNPIWQNAQIKMHVTDVTPGGSGTRARVGFLFDSITLKTGETKSFAGFVDSSAVVRRGGGSSSSASSSHAASMAQPPSSITGRSQTNTVFWQHKVGSGSSSNAPTGGYAYARTPGAAVTLPAGSLVTLELATSLDIP